METITLPKSVFDELLRMAREIATCDKSDGEFGYCHALGKCNGTAKVMIINLEVFGAASLQDIDAARRAEILEAEREEGIGGTADDERAEQMRRY